MCQATHRSTGGEQCEAERPARSLHSLVCGRWAHALRINFILHMVCTTSFFPYLPMEQRPGLVGLHLCQFNSPGFSPAFIYTIIWAEIIKFCACSLFCPTHLATACMLEPSYLQQSWARSWWGTVMNHQLRPMGAWFTNKK